MTSTTEEQTDRIQTGAEAFPHRHLLGIQGLTPQQITHLLNLAETYVDLSRQIEKKTSLLKGRTLINLFFEASTRTQASFELAGKRLGADTMNMSVKTSSVSKGETLIDTAVTLNAMRPDILIVRHASSGQSISLPRRLTARWSMPVTVRTSTRHRPFSTHLQFAEILENRGPNCRHLRRYPT